MYTLLHARRVMYVEVCSDLCASIPLLHIHTRTCTCVGLGPSVYKPGAHFPPPSAHSNVHTLAVTFKMCSHPDKLTDLLSNLQKHIISQPTNTHTLTEQCKPQRLQVLLEGLSANHPKPFTSGLLYADPSACLLLMFL